MVGIALVAAALAGLAITPFVLRTSRVLGLFDVPTEARRVHTQPIPRLGGVAVFASTVLVFAILALVGGLPTVTGDKWQFFGGLLLSGTLVFAVGLWDDLHGLPPATKLLTQVVAAILVFAFGFRVDVISIGASHEVLLGTLALPITVLWVVGVTNAFNLIDGLDGLATGLGIVALSTTLVVALLLGNSEVALVCAVLVGALFGFLRYNFNPARIFLGDSGSLFVGFMLAVLSVHGSMKSPTAVLFIIPLFALALPLFDTALAIMRRWLRGVPLHGADARHIHHRLLALGLTQRTAVLVLYLVACGMAVLGVVLAFAPPPVLLGTASLGGAAMVGVLLYGMRRLGYHEFAEAGLVLVSGVTRMRRIIQDQIFARDLIPLIRAANTLEELETVLEAHVPRFGFLGIEVCRETSSCRRRIAHVDQYVVRAWKLDFPVTPRVSADDDAYVLRIWCALEMGHRPFGAERVARILAPTIEEWLGQMGLTHQRVRPFVSAQRAATTSALEPAKVDAHLGVV